MKIIIAIVLILSFFLFGKDAIHEWTLRSMATNDFTERCKEEIKCIEAIEAQVEDCLKKAKWQELMDDTEDEAVKKYFAKTLTTCFDDEEGNPYFAS